MKALLIYSTKYGTTQKYAEMIQKHAITPIDCHNVQSEVPDMSQYGTIILASSIYMGRIRKDMRQFCEKYDQQLQLKRLYLCIVGVRSGEELQAELATAYPEKLRQVAISQIAFGGSVPFAKLKFIDKKIMKMVSKEDPNFPTLDNTSDLSFLEEKQLIEFATTISG